MTDPLSSPPPAANAVSGCSRRGFLQRSIGTALVAGTASGTGAQTAAAPAYQVSPWRGPLPALGLVDTGGKSWQPSDLQGRAVLLNFWASWSPLCRAEMPSLQAVAELYGPNRLLVLASNFKEPASRAIKFASTTGVSLPVLLDSDGKFAAQHGVKVFPTTLLLHNRGHWTSREAEALIAGLLKA